MLIQNIQEKGGARSVPEVVQDVLPHARAARLGCNVKLNFNSAANLSGGGPRRRRRSDCTQDMVQQTNPGVRRLRDFLAHFRTKHVIVRIAALAF